MAEEIDDEILEELYAWIDGIPLTRPKKDIRRDFADGGWLIACSPSTQLLKSLYGIALTIVYD